MLITVAVGGLLAWVAPPAGAVGTAGAFISGNVNLSPGIPTGNACSGQAWVFTPITLGGVIAGTDGSLAGTDVAVTLITTSLITGNSTAYPLPLPPPIGCVGNQENETSGAGLINPFTFTGTTAIVGTVRNGSCGGGTYLRVGKVETIDFTNCGVDVIGPPGASAGRHLTFDMRVAGLFVPNAFMGSNGVTTQIHDALLYGAWAAAGTS